MAKNTRRVYREKICCNTSANKVTIDTVIQQEPVWLEPWWQQLYPGTCSWSWLAADTSSLACLWDTNTCSECGFECTRQPKGHWCAPSVSKFIRINQSVVMSRGGFLWVIQMAVKKGGVNAVGLVLPLMCVINKTTPAVFHTPCRTHCETFTLW